MLGTGLRDAASTAAAVYSQTVSPKQKSEPERSDLEIFVPIALSTLALFKAKERRAPSAISLSGPSTLCGRFETLVGTGRWVFDIWSHRCSVVVI
jgi:hypothetical protein